MEDVSKPRALSIRELAARLKLSQHFAFLWCLGGALQTLLAAAAGDAPELCRQ